MSKLEFFNLEKKPINLQNETRKDSTDEQKFNLKSNLTTTII